MKIRLIILLLLFVFVPVEFAVCVPAQRTLYVPAVINENYSEMIPISVETVPGTGLAYISIGATIGPYTQESEEIAAKVAYTMVDIKECDILLRIDTSDSIRKIDGPSAGAAMTILMLSALKNEQLRQDFAITGTIEENGNIGSVGGIPLKAEAVAKFNKRLLLVPILDSTDKILALIIQKSYNLTIFQVKDIKEAYNIARSTVMLDSNIELGKEKVPSFANASLKHIYSPYFLKVVEKMLSEAEDVAVEVGAKQIRAKDNIISRLEIAKVANATGNYYTAANTVFLLMMDSNLLDYSDSNFIAHIEKVRSCIEEFKLNDVSNSSLSNFELAGAANLRYLWAKKKFPTDINAGTLSGKLNIYKDVLLSEGWCQAAIDMSSYEHTNGIINMTKANELANRLLQIASSHAAVTSEDGNADAKWHLEVAKEAYSNEMYVEAIIDANFALAYEKIYDLGNKSLNEAGKEIIQILEENRVKNYTFLWPQLYQNHARTFEESDSVSAARLYLFADGLEQSFSEIFNASVTYKQNQTPEIGINQKEFVNISNTQNQTNLTDTQTKIARTSSEQKLSEGWNFRYLLYILIIIAIGYIVQYERKKLQDKKKMQ